VNSALWFREEVPDIRMHSANNKHRELLIISQGAQPHLHVESLPDTLSKKGKISAALGGDAHL
jgi:hypothetical protein